MDYSSKSNGVNPRCYLISFLFGKWIAGLEYVDWILKSYIPVNLSSHDVFHIHSKVFATLSPTRF